MPTHVKLLHCGMARLAGMEVYDDLADASCVKRSFDQYILHP